MGLTMQEKSSRPAGPFPLPERRSERKFGHPGRIHQHYEVRSPYQRLPESEALPPEVKAEIADDYPLDPRPQES
jgi:hypothetical protein